MPGVEYVYTGHESSGKGKDKEQRTKELDKCWQIVILVRKIELPSV